MRSLKDILESLLDANYDVSDEEVSPIKLFVDKYKSDSKRSGHYYIKGDWSMEEMDKLLLHYGHCAGTVQTIDTDKLLQAVHSKKDVIVLVAPYRDRHDFYILIPVRGRKWDHYTCDPGYWESSLFRAFHHDWENIRYSNIFTTLDTPIKVYRLKSDKFLKDLQKYLA